MFLCGNLTVCDGLRVLFSHRASSILFFPYTCIATIITWYKSPCAVQEADLRAHYMLRYDEGLDSAIHAVMNDSSKVHLQEVKTYPTWFTVLLKELDLANLGEHVVAKCTSAIKQDRQNVRVE